jgi:hypothetical protein
MLLITTYKVHCIRVYGVLAGQKMRHMTTFKSETTITGKKMRHKTLNRSDIYVTNF